MDVYADIKEMIARLFYVGEEEIREDAHLQEDLGADSLLLLDLAEALSKQYGIEIEADELVDLENVAELVEKVRERVGSAAGS